LKGNKYSFKHVILQFTALIFDPSLWRILIKRFSFQIAFRRQHNRQSIIAFRFHKSSARRRLLCEASVCNVQVLICISGIISCIAREVWLSLVIGYNRSFKSSKRFGPTHFYHAHLSFVFLVESLQILFSLLSSMASDYLAIK
jgi:hypothetical protein